MSTDFDISILRKGDCLLYGPSDLFGWLTAIKTWCKQAVHVEIYDGNCMSLASRNGIGVNRYSFRERGLTAVRRPKIWIHSATPALDERWFDKLARGQAYDWLGILCFTLAVKQGAIDKMFCSEYATRQYRIWNFEPFNPDADSDMIAPSEFWQAGTFETIWKCLPTI